MRNQRDHQLFLLLVLGHIAEQILAENRYVHQTWNPANYAGILVRHQPAQQAHFPVLQPDVSLVLLLSDDGLAEACLLYTSAAARNLEVVPLSRYTRGRVAREGLQLGFAAVDSREIRRGVEQLALALKAAGSR